MQARVDREEGAGGGGGGGDCNLTGVWLCNPVTQSGYASGLCNAASTARCLSDATG